jgi:hypothetical protein
MARILGQANINKLSGDNVLNLLYYAPDREKMAEILGLNNINKLTYSDLEVFFDNYRNVGAKIALKKLLKQHYTGKSRKIISLLKQ